MEGIVEFMEGIRNLMEGIIKELRRKEARN
jgi:hypothetical protein